MLYTIFTNLQMFTVNKLYNYHHFSDSQCLYEPHLLRQNDTIRVFALVALTVGLAFTEYAAADVSFSTRTAASGTFHTVTFQRHFIWQITGTMAFLWDETFAFHGKPIVLWVQ